MESIDITEPKKQRAPSPFDFMHNYLVKYAPTGIYEIDYTGQKFRSVNEAMCQIPWIQRARITIHEPLRSLIPKKQETIPTTNHKYPKWKKNR